MTALLIAFLRHLRCTAGVTFFVVCFVAFTTAQREGVFAVALGVVLGLFFGLVFVFGGEWADIEDHREA